MAESKTVRLYPMFREHLVPFMVALVAYNVVVLVLALAGVPLPPAALLLVIFALVHTAQMVWLVTVRFDDDAITITRPWRRQRIEWSRVNGLILTGPHTAAAKAANRPFYCLRLVLDGNVATKSMSAAQARALGPMLTTVSGDVLDHVEKAPRREIDCWDDIVQGLAQHGFRSPPPRVWVYRPAAHDQS